MAMLFWQADGGKEGGNLRSGEDGRERLEEGTASLLEKISMLFFWGGGFFYFFVIFLY